MEIEALAPRLSPVGSVLDVSLDGLSIDRPPGRAAGSLPRRLVLAYQGEVTAPTQVRAVDHEGPRLGLQFVHPEPRFLGQLAGFLSDIHRRRRTEALRRPVQIPTADGQWQLLDNPGQLQLFCRTISCNHVSARVESYLGHRLGRAVLVRGRLRKGRIVMEWDWTAEMPPVLPCDLYFEGHGAVYRLRVEDLERKKDRIVTHSAPCVARKQQRRFPRVRPDVPIALSFEHPLIPGRRLTKQVSDLSYGGVGFEVDVAADLLVHELQIPEVCITLPGERQVRARARVCHNFERRVEGRVYCGLELQRMPRGHRNTWQGLVEQHVLPHVQRADWPALNRIWQHYDGAGYFSLSGKTPEDFAAVKAPFVEIWSRINGAEGAGQLAVWKHNNEVIGSLTASRVYSPTMLIQGLATRKLPDQPTPGRGTISRDLYFYVFHHALHDPSVRYVLAYLCMGSARTWHKRLCEEYAETWPDRAYSYLFYLMEAHDLFHGIDPRPGAGEGAVQLCPAGPEDLAWLVERAEAESPLLAEALDLQPGRLGLEQVNGVLAAAGLFRHRVVLVARAGGERLALAVVEAGNDHLNPYNLFDSVRLVTGDADHPLKNEACTTLLLEAQKLLTSMGKRQCVLFAQADQVPSAERAGFQAIDEGLCWVINRDGFASYLSHIFEIIAPD